MTMIGVVGYGVVGKAVANGFSKRCGYEVLVNDVLPSRSKHSKHQLWKSCDYIFICVPTPEFDMRQVYNAVEELQNPPVTVSDLEYYGQNWKPPIIIVKSTVTVGTTRRLSKKYPHLKFICNPEFLREKSAEDDFLYPDRIIIGAEDPATAKSVARLYNGWRCPIIEVTPEQAEAVKLLSNAFLVAKVAFGLESAEICRGLGVEDAAKVLRLVGLDQRIGQSHLDPSKGKIPFNTPCLHKDLEALLSQCRNCDIDTPLLDIVREVALE